MVVDQAVLDVYQAGELTVVGFGGREILREINFVTVREEIFDLVERHNCRQLAIDLTGVAFVPSGLPGLLASLQTKNVEVMIYNASEEIRDVIDCTNLHETVQFCDVAV